jgi:8-oxo-dGTP pyrophosphatase MutT (NUDIX family)
VLIPHSTGVGSSASSRQLAKETSSARLRQSPGRQQVAAVCYRTGSQGLEFLLIQTRGGRWIFPKGGVEPGLTQAQSAALEAFEEAGVHGRIEEMPFARYHNGNANRKSSSKSRKNTRKADDAGTRGESVTAHLCEVSYLEPPQEANRNPTWFSPEKAKRRLLEDRAAQFGDELAGLVDRAVTRIRRLEAIDGRGSQKDALQKVRFEAFENRGFAGGENEAALVRYLMLEHRGARSAVLDGKGPGEAGQRRLRGSS